MSAVLNTVYNNYLTTYTPKSVSRYDTHKKSELRNVYNSIVKINKESPWYLPTTNEDTQQYAVNLKENARMLHNTIAQLGGLEENGLLSKKSAFSTNEDIATASYIGTDSTDGMSPKFTLEVTNLATSQENLGEFLPDAKVALPAATYSFDVSINDMNYEFQFSINENETNRDVQSRLARLINNSDIGLKASVEESEGLTALKLVSEATGLPGGKSQIFTISDDRTSKISGTVNYFGLDYVSKEASNASFKVNGEERTASSNHFTVGKLFEINLHGISPEGEDIQIGLKTDTESLTDNVSHLIQGYNDFIKATSSYLESQARSKQLMREMGSIANLFHDSMESTGLTFNEDGTLTLDRNVLSQTANEAENVAETFDYLKDFSSALLRKSTQISLNPMDYVERTVVAYKNPGRNFASPYSTSAYSGMMFNGYC